MTWERFARLFRDKYLGEARLATKVREFVDLRQGAMSVVEYTAKFDELARFPPTIVLTDDARKMKYMLRLRTEIVNHTPKRRTVRLFGDWEMQTLSWVRSFRIPEEYRVDIAQALL